MHLASALLVVACSTFALAMSSPDAFPQDGQVLSLSNSVGMVNVTIDNSMTDSSPGTTRLRKRDGIFNIAGGDCKGPSKCNNNMEDDCYTAFKLIKDSQTTYGGRQ